MIAIDHWPPTPREYVALKAAGKIRHIPSPSERAADEARARERAEARADELLRVARG